ncbi:MAG: hypothetical protein ACRCX8_11730 [Sarcina sp.]
MLDEMKEILGNLFAEYGLTNDILRLSQVIDVMIVGEIDGNKTISK